MHLSDLPALNATLNATSGALLVGGFLMIRRRRVAAHATFMIAAVLVSVAFLASYLTYHSRAGTTRFTRQGWVRPTYFAVLTSHTVLAAVTALGLVPVTLARAVRRRFDRHRRLARWTLPIWLYVCVTGVVIYLMLYGHHFG